MAAEMEGNANDDNDNDDSSSVKDAETDEEFECANAGTSAPNDSTACKPGLKQKSKCAGQISRNRATSKRFFI